MTTASVGLWLALFAGEPPNQRVDMNNVIYIVGLVVVVGAVLSWIGFH